MQPFPPPHPTTDHVELACAPARGRRAEPAAPRLLEPDKHSSRSRAARCASADPRARPFNLFTGFERTRTSFRAAAKAERRRRQNHGSSSASARAKRCATPPTRTESTRTHRDTPSGRALRLRRTRTRPPWSTPATHARAHHTSSATRSRSPQKKNTRPARRDLR